MKGQYYFHVYIRVFLYLFFDLCFVYIGILIYFHFRPRVHFVSKTEFRSLELVCFFYIFLFFIL